MTPVATRIYDKIKTLQHDREDILSRIKKLTQDSDSIKRLIHRSEAEIMVEGAATSLAGIPDFHLANEVRKLTQERKELKNDEATLHELSIQLKTLEHTIEQCTFWMHRADSSDITRQQEAEKKVFG